jgi:hypothetical protein
LHVVCHHCGQRNARAQARCSECGRKLHRSWFRRFESRVLGKRKKVTWLQLGLLLLGILVGAALIYFLAEFKLPQPESFYAPLFPTHRFSHA